jgi:hypothetical protein
MTLRSGSMAAVSVASAVAAAILLAAAVIERVKPTPEPVARALDPSAPPGATAPPDAAPAAPQPVELLHAVPSTVAVSSTVDNAAILPEHLVDRDLATAWNSRTGDTAGAWIAIRVPREVHVDEIRMSAGFTHQGPKGDLFTMNQRIQQVRVSRAGAVILEKRLDPESRNLQELPIDAAGGDFRIEVTELIPGTELTWREVCVSELEVWGTLPASMTPSDQRPTVRVGSLDPRPTLGIRAHGSATALPLAIAAHGWAYLGREDVDPGRGAIRAEQTYYAPASGDVIGLELRSAVDLAALPRRYRGARRLAVVLYSAQLEPLCEGVLDGLEAAVQSGLGWPGTITQALVDDLARVDWMPPYSIVAKIDAPCADAAHWVRSADLPPLSGVVTRPPPDHLAKEVRTVFQALLSYELNERAVREAAKSTVLVYVPPATPRGHGYISASFQIDECETGELARWGLWQTSGKALLDWITGTPYDAIIGAVDIDGDGVPEVLTDMGEIAGDDHIAWIQDLHGTKPAGLGCDGQP